MLFEAQETQENDRTCQGALMSYMKTKYVTLKVMCLYLDIRIIGHTFCSMLNKSSAKVMTNLYDKLCFGP